MAWQCLCVKVCIVQYVGVWMWVVYVSPTCKTQAQSVMWELFDREEKNTTTHNPLTDTLSCTNKLSCLFQLTSTYLESWSVAQPQLPNAIVKLMTDWFQTGFPTNTLPICQWSGKQSAPPQNSRHWLSCCCRARRVGILKQTELRFDRVTETVFVPLMVYF